MDSRVHLGPLLLGGEPNQPWSPLSQRPVPPPAWCGQGPGLLDPTREAESLPCAYLIGPRSDDLGLHSLSSAPFLRRVGKPLEPGLGLLWKCKGLSYYMGLHLRKASAGFSVPSKRMYFLRDPASSWSVQKLRSPNPGEASSRAALCKSGLMEGWTESLFQAVKGREE